MILETRMVKDLGHPLNKTPFDHTYPEPLCDLRPFQSALERLFGREPKTGRPWVRVIWAQDQRADEYGPIAKNWDHYGAGGRGEWRARYLYASERHFEPETDYDTGIISHREVWEDLSPPRFVIENLIPPETALLGWADPGHGGTRTIFNTFYDGAGDRFTPFKPTAGFYQPLPITQMPHMAGGILAYHDRGCCRAAEVSDRTCYGYYVEPGAPHLEIMAGIANEILNRRKERRPALMTEAEATASRKQSQQNNDQYWDRYRERIKQISLEACNTHEPVFSGSDKMQRHGKYKFLGGASKSGATVEQIESWRKEKATNGNGS